MPDSSKPSLGSKLVWGSVVYLLFVAVGSVVPLYFEASHYFGMGLFDFALLESGDLLLISIVIAFGSIGDLLYTFLVRKSFEIIPVGLVGALGFAQGVVVLVSIQKYISATYPVRGVIAGQLHPASVAHGSYWMYGAAIVIGWSSLVLRMAEEDR